MECDTVLNEKLILFVDKEKEVYDVALHALSQAGYKAIWAENGEKGLSMAERKKPDLIVLDPNLPDKDGIQILAKLKAMREDVPVVILTEKASVMMVRRSLEYGAHDFLTKPFELYELCDTIQDALEFNEVIIDENEKYPQPQSQPGLWRR